MPDARVWLDNVTFRNIVQPQLPDGVDPTAVPVGSAVAASNNVFLVLVVLHPCLLPFCRCVA